MKSKLEQLKDFLQSVQYQGRLLANPEAFDCWTEGGIVEPCSTRKDGNGIIAARFAYQGTISINPCYAPSALVSTFVACWIQENLERYDSNSFEFSNDMNDDKSSDFELTIAELHEDIELVLTENGPFVIGKQNYDFGESSLWIAEQFKLDAQVASA
ncbi:phage tail protein [Pseudoalteromonas luteoviolacea]|uniref:phage tail protein n=1 Tax=Pseudoalteromonas luteoviolacea TaxID=43657 RepID=UPI001B3867FD|nr:phage tail protein [Pseudoalteromonas luteoviolacea]MBQ4836784.1 phage tail protein [Pseudoalteromonas luteoviolacea]